MYTVLVFEIIAAKMLCVLYLLSLTVPWTGSHLAVETCDRNHVYVGGVTLADGKTAIMIKERGRFRAFLTADFYDYGLDTREIRHIEGSVGDGDYLDPDFVVYDRNTSGYGNNYIISGGSAFYSLLADDIQTGKPVKYCRYCGSFPVDFSTSVSWDSRLNFWLGETIVLRNLKSFCASRDLKTWQIQTAYSPFPDLHLEIFPIADDADADNVTWIVVYKSTDSKLMYGTFDPNFNVVNFQEVGILDYSDNWVDFSIVNDNRTDLRKRRCLATLASDSGNSPTAFVSGRSLSYSGGRLRQLPIYSSLGPEGDLRIFDLESTTLLPGQNPLSNVTPSATCRIDAELVPIEGSCVFRLFVNPNDPDQYGVSVAVDSSTVTLSGLGGKVTVIPYTKTGETVDVVINVATGFVESFIEDGLYAGSLRVTPGTTWNKCGLSSLGKTLFNKLSYAANIKEGGG